MGETLTKKAPGRKAARGFQKGGATCNLHITPTVQIIKNGEESNKKAATTDRLASSLQINQCRKI